MLILLTRNSKMWVRKLDLKYEIGTWVDQSTFPLMSTIECLTCKTKVVLSSFVNWRVNYSLKIPWYPLIGFVAITQCTLRKRTKALGKSEFLQLFLQNSTQKIEVLLHELYFDGFCLIYAFIKKKKKFSAR